MKHSPANSRLFIFDMDGTLLPGSTGLLELARLFNTETELYEMERLYSTRQLTTQEFTKAVGKLWGKVALEESRRAFDAARKIDGIVECLAAIKAKGHVSCLITMSQDIFARHFKASGFDYVVSTTYPPNTDGSVTILEPDDKCRIAQEICASHQLNYLRSVAFGDSLSDEPLFADLTETVAVNATPELRSLSKYIYTGTSILDAYHLLDL